MVLDPVTLAPDEEATSALRTARRAT